MLHVDCYVVLKFVFDGYESAFITCVVIFTRSQLKLALRYCKQHEDTMRADALANNLAIVRTIGTSGHTLGNITITGLLCMQPVLVAVRVIIILRISGCSTTSTCTTRCLTLMLKYRCYSVFRISTLLTVTNWRCDLHSLQLPEHSTYLSDCNFLTRMLYKNVY